MMTWRTLGGWTSVGRSGILGSMVIDNVLQLALQFGNLGVLAVFFCYVLPVLVSKVIKTLENRDAVYTKAIEKIADVVARNSAVVEKSNLLIERLIATMEKNHSQ
jgi:uncharacterized coiled-coil protein SlyX